MPDTWVLYALVAFLGFFFVNLLFKVVSTENPLLVSLILYGAAALVMLLILVQKKEFAISTKGIIIAILIGLSSVTGTIFALKSIKIAPNPGYSSAIYQSGFVLITILSIFLFGSSLTLKKFIGILTTLLGLILLSF